ASNSASKALFRREGTGSMREAPLIWLVVPALLISCRSGSGYTRPPPPVRVQVVGGAGPAHAVRYSGRGIAATEVSVAFRVGGYINAVTTTIRPDGTRRLLQAGDPVRRSAILAAIRRSDYATRLDELRGMRADMNAAVAKAKLDLDRALQLLGEPVLPQRE